ncbi:hypothetical protein HQN90_31325 [Paenibacillus alba]|uniref:hypothetical protein n=1 Tax=Paenibacillus alba TaxID=1197127 RepID=UPI0015635413|nr:hypothetical protein [Paenibacillus alba]NQX70640.1 hypothetical protein [Paenibacillus alba]
MSEIKNIPVSISERLKNIARDSVATFLKPIYQSILREQEFFGRWTAAEKIWSNPGPSNMSVF